MLIRLALCLFCLGGIAVSESRARDAQTAMTIDRNRTALVFIEFQDEWIGENATLRRLLVKDEGQFDDAVENARLVLQAARDGGWRIAHAGLDLRHDPTYQIFAGGKGVMGLRRAIPNANTWTGEGAEFVQPFVPQADEFKVVGRSGASVLANSTLDPYLRNNGVTTLIIMGFATHVCVESTLRDAHDRGYNVYVVTDASGAFTKTQADYFKDNVVHHFGTAVTAKEAVEALGRKN